jgi:D-glycero-alpha-D-manno-heptose 1-phosphate guanylyltransferase|tara:strand:- start:1332 stop:2024 length:693 start_codon:yes stop_codon:yes gene_type:complete
MEAIILAGGFGKRLKSKVRDIPKPMAPVNNRPFLDYLLDYLIKNKIKQIIFSVYYKYDLIKDYYRSSYKGMNISYSIDNEALGTGGAIMAALLKSKNENVFIINGDTFFNVKLSNLFNNHVDNNNDITLSLKSMTNFKRYGFVETDTRGQVHSFREKEYRNYGEIDGGIYLIKRNIFHSLKRRKKFSFNEFIMDNLKQLKVGSILFDELFIDIGLPEDYEQAHIILKNQR